MEARFDLKFLATALPAALGVVLLAAASLFVLSSMPHASVQRMFDYENRHLNLLGQNSWKAAYSPNTNSILLTGHIGQGMVRELESLLRRHPKARQIVLNSPGGDDAAVKRALKIVSAIDIPVLVAEHRCASECFDVWAAATHRFAAPTSAEQRAVELESADEWARLRSMAGKRTLSIDDVRAVAARLTEHVSEPPPIKVALTHEYSPVFHLQSMENGFDKKVYGRYVAWWSERNWSAGIVLSEMRDRDDIQNALAHEIFGHGGMDLLMREDNDLWRKRLIQLAVLRPDLVENRRRRYSYSEDIEDTIASADEAVALISGSLPDLTVLDKTLISYRKWIRANINRELHYSDLELVADFVIPAREVWFKKSATPE